MPDRQKLYVYETPHRVVTSWVSPDVTMTGRFRWIKDMYYHPEVEIFCGKSANVKRRKTDAIDQAVLQALHAENIGLMMLKRKSKQGYTRSVRAEVSKRQARLF